MSNSTDQQPDDLMNHFQGRGLKGIIIFTIIVHLAVISVTSTPFLLGKLKDPNEGLSNDQRIENAVKEANETLAKIAKTHGVQTAQLRRQMAAGRPTPKPTPNESSGDLGNGNDTTTGTSKDDEPPKDGEIRGDSDIENKLQEKLNPPTLPPVNDTDDLFE